MSSKHERPAPTLSDVAALAGVSLSTASRVLNGSARRVSSEYEKRVLRAADEAGYRTNLAAQAVALGRQRGIGLLVHDVRDPYFSELASGVIAAAEANERVLLIGITERDPRREARHVERFMSQRLESIIVSGSRRADKAGNAKLSESLRAYIQSGGLAVAITQPGLPVPTITFAEERASELLVDRLIELGYQRFGLIDSFSDILTAQMRREALRKTLNRYSQNLIMSAPYSFDDRGGYDGARELLYRDPSLDCVLALSDYAAMGAHASLAESGRIVGENIGLTGFGDIALARLHQPGLTTIRYPLFNVGYDAAQMVLDPSSVRGGDTLIVEGDAIIRGSTPRRY